MNLDVINEKTTFVITATFRDLTGELVTPSSASYRIDDVISGSEIRGDTPFTPEGSSYDITISKDENRILDNAHNTEERIVTVKFVFGIDNKEGNGEYRYIVKNLLKIN